MAGLAASWILGERFHITLFEKKSALGLGHLSYKVSKADGGHKIDIPPRVINATHYQHLFELIGETGLSTYKVRQQPSFSFKNGETYLAFKTYNFFNSSVSLPNLSSATMRWLFSHGLELSRWFNFIRSASTEALTEDVAINGSNSLSGYLKAKGYSDDFIFGFLFPMWSLMCTCDYPNVEKFPIVPIIELFRDFTGSASTRRILGGSEALENKVRTRITDTHFETSVGQLKMSADGEKITVYSDLGKQDFDHVIVATEPTHAQKLAADVYPSEFELIGKVPTYDTHMVMHTDRKLMPKNDSSWAPVNMFWDPVSQKSSATLWMNQLEAHSDLQSSIFQSWDPIVEPDESMVLARRTFRRSLASSSSQSATKELRSRMAEIKDRRLWFAGSYVSAGIPLLENGVHSAKMVCSRILERLELA